VSIVKIRAALETAINTMVGIIPAVAIASSVPGAEAIFTTTAPHLLTSRVSVTISGHTGSTPNLNGTYIVSVIDATSFSLTNTITGVAIASTVAGVGGVISANLTAWEGVAFAQVTGVPYQKVYLIPATPENPTFGGNFSREIGFCQVNLFYPIQRGTAAVMTRAELIRSTFPRGSTFSFSGVTVRILKTPTISPGVVDEESFMVPIRIPYQADIFS